MYNGYYYIGKQEFCMCVVQTASRSEIRQLLIRVDFKEIFGLFMLEITKTRLRLKLFKVDIYSIQVGTTILTQNIY